MCELFAMSARQPATVSLSLEEFARHGGETARHRDGWGVVRPENSCSFWKIVMMEPMRGGALHDLVGIGRTYWPAIRCVSIQ